MLFRRVRRALLGALALAAGHLVASVPTPFTTTSDFQSQTASKGTLIVTVTANVDLPSAAYLTVTQPSGNVYIDSSPRYLGLHAGASATVMLTVELVNAIDPVEYAVVRVRVGERDLGLSGTVLYFGTAGGNLTLLTPRQKDQIATATDLKRAQKDAEERARQIIGELRQRGKRVVPSTIAPIGSPTAGVAAPEALSQKVFDSLVGPAPQIPICGRFTDSIDNIAYVVTGVPLYEDPSIPPGPRHLPALGNDPIRLETQVLQEDDCGNTRVVTRYYYGNASNNNLNMSVVSIVPPGEGMPVLSLRATCPDAGLVTGDLVQGLAFQSDPQTLSGASVRGTFYSPARWDLGGATGTATEFFAGATHSYLFQWQILTNKVRTSWAGKHAGFGPYTASFRSGYWQPTYPANNAFFHPTYDLVYFGHDAQYASDYLSAHEYGHFLEHNLQAGNWLLISSYWDQCSLINSATTSFQEGFADFCSAATVWNRVDAFPVAEGNQFQPVTFCQAGECFRAACVGQGEYWTLNVTGIFWDLFDTGTDGGQDTITYPWGLLLNWCTNPYVDFNAFFQDFANRGLFGAQCPAVLALRAFDHIAGGTCP
jgi:hypothetical protein